MVSVIVLDVDETLIHSSTSKRKKQEDSFQISGYQCIRRPHLDKFIEHCFDRFDHVVIWSAGTEDYVHEICEMIFSDRKPHLILTRDDCELDGKTLIKPIDKVRRLLGLDDTPTYVVHVDDTPCTFSHNTLNGLRIKRFYGGEDDALLHLMDWTNNQNADLYRKPLML